MMIPLTLAVTTVMVAQTSLSFPFTGKVTAVATQMMVGTTPISALAATEMRVEAVQVSNRRVLLQVKVRPAQDVLPVRIWHGD